MTGISLSTLLHRDVGWMGCIAQGIYCHQHFVYIINNYYYDIREMRLVSRKRNCNSNECNLNFVSLSQKFYLNKNIHSVAYFFTASLGKYMCNKC